MPLFISAQTADKSDWKDGYPEACTSITVGKAATFDGSVMTSHTDDSHRTRSWMDIVPSKKHKANAVSKMYKRVQDTTRAMPAYAHNEIGSIPQVKKTNGFINTAYPSMNDKQKEMLFDHIHIGEEIDKELKSQGGNPRYEYYEEWYMEEDDFSVWCHTTMDNFDLVHFLLMEVGLEEDNIIFIGDDLWNEKIFDTKEYYDLKMCFIIFHA